MIFVDKNRPYSKFRKQISDTYRTVFHYSFMLFQFIGSTPFEIKKLFVLENGFEPKKPL